MAGKRRGASQGTRHEALVKRTVEAIAVLSGEDKRVSFYSVAERVGVSRSTLYRNGDLRGLVMEGRKRPTVKPTAASPPALPCSESVESQLDQALRERNMLLRMLNALCGGERVVPCCFALVAY